VAQVQGSPMYVSAVYKPTCIVRSSLKLDLVLESQLIHSK
jgi:hypothetical protein